MPPVAQSPDSGLAFRLERVSRRFGQVTALADIDLELAAGQATLILGPNGAGKSTLLRIVAGLVRPTMGRVLAGGPSAWRPMDQRHRASIGYLGHKSLLHDYLTARENLVLYGRLYGLDGAEAGGRADGWLEEVGLARAAHRPVRGFSRGMLQRLALARALIHAPKALLLDEPASGLDAEGRERLAALIARRRTAGVTLLYVSHHPEAALPLVDRVLIVHRGRVIEDDAAAARSGDEWARAAAAGAGRAA